MCLFNKLECVLSFLIFQIFLLFFFEWLQKRHVMVISLGYLFLDCGHNCGGSNQNLGCCPSCALRGSAVTCFERQYFEVIFYSWKIIRLPLILLRVKKKRLNYSYTFSITQNMCSLSKKKHNYYSRTGLSSSDIAFAFMANAWNAIVTP